jgi:hypothetical protein
MDVEEVHFEENWEEILNGVLSAESISPDSLRESLREEVWKDPVRVVARRYGISDVALAKRCKRLGIPVPPRGHWMKVRANPSVSDGPAASAPLSNRVNQQTKRATAKHPVLRDKRVSRSEQRGACHGGSQKPHMTPRTDTI